VTGEETYGLFHLQAGGCGGCSLEVEALGLAGLDRLGIRLVASPRHADLLLVSGVVTRALRPAVDAAWAAMASPKHLIAAGDCALDGGLFRDSYAVDGGIRDLPVSLMIPGCPPPPPMILEGLEMLLDALGRTGREPNPAPEAGPGAGSDARPGLPATERQEPPPPSLVPHRPARLPEAPRHRLGGGDSSGG